MLVGWKGVAIGFSCDLTQAPPILRYYRENQPSIAAALINRSSISDIAVIKSPWIIPEVIETGIPN